MIKLTAWTVSRAYIPAHNAGSRCTVSLIARVAICCLLALAGGCSTLPKDVDRPESYALTDTADTLLGRLTDPVEAKHPGRSGFYLLDDGLDALESRLAMADLAERSIDVQTYEWGADVAGGLVAQQLWSAANRGVRVRVLIDDYLNEDADFNLAAFDSHPNAEVRIFNPFGARLEPVPILRLRRNIELVTKLSRLNHRMHNKSFVVDDQVAVIGGRNVSDYYYGLSDDFNFIDFDLLLTGPQVDEVSFAFDEYWNSEWAYPITVFRDHPPDEQMQKWFDESGEELGEKRRQIGIPPSIDIGPDDLEKFIDGLKWAHAEIVYDDPDKARGRNPKSGTEVSAKLRELSDQTESELIIISPYFVPGPIEGTLGDGLIDRGVKVRILTNSLASTNQPAVHSGYARYRKEIIEAGVEMHETQPWLPDQVQQERVPWSTAQAGLHAKVLIFDREEIFVGTFNLDPRSVRLNTEMGLVVYDSDLGVEIGELADAVFSAEASYRVELDEDGNLRWTGTESGVEVIHTDEPHASFMRKLTVFLASLLPIEEQL